MTGAPRSQLHRAETFGAQSLMTGAIRAKLNKQEIIMAIWAKMQNKIRIIRAQLKNTGSIRAHVILYRCALMQTSN
jgi:hypothetical protein